MIIFWMNWLSLKAEKKPIMLSMIFSTNTECDVPGEIDITRTRWSEKPITLVPLILK